MSAETREQFRERIGRVLTEADGGDWDRMAETYREDYSDWAEAVYTAALRDVRHLMTAIPDDYWTPVQFVEQIGELAASLGIDMEGGDT